MSRLSAAILGVLILATTLSAQTTAPATAPARLAIPTAAEQARGRALVRQVFAREFEKTAFADRRKLAQTLLSQARDTHDDSAARYALLMEASQLAAGTADALTALAALDEAARVYALDNLLDLKREALARASAALGGPTLAADAEALMRAALAAAHDAVEADAFGLVLPLANLAEGAANRTLKVSVVSAIQADLQGLRNLAAEYEKVRAALDRLATPDSASAAADHLLVGRFYAFGVARWDRALPHLAASGDAVFADLARKELAGPAEAAWVELADGWSSVAEKLTAPAERRRALAHASELYRKAQAALQGITLTRIQSRMAAINTEITGSGTAAPAAQAAVNLLALVDPARDACGGSWTAGGGTLAVASAPYATLQLPFTPPEEYDLSASFTRTEGAGPIALLLVAKGRAFGFSLDTRGEARFERVNGKVAQDNPTVVPVAVSNGRRYTLLVQVRKDALRALLDGKLLVEYKPDPAYKDLSRYPSWKLTDATLLGVGAHNAKVTFHVIELVEVTGKGKPTRP
jgi:hypothetical protein